MSIHHDTKMTEWDRRSAGLVIRWCTSQRILRPADILLDIAESGKALHWEEAAQYALDAVNDDWDGYLVVRGPLDDPERYPTIRVIDYADETGQDEQY